MNEEVKPYRGRLVRRGYSLIDASASDADARRLRRALVGIPADAVQAAWRMGVVDE